MSANTIRQCRSYKANKLFQSKVESIMPHFVRLIDLEVLVKALGGSLRSDLAKEVCGYLDEVEGWKNPPSWITCSGVLCSLFGMDPGGHSSQDEVRSRNILLAFLKKHYESASIPDFVWHILGHPASGSTISGKIQGHAPIPKGKNPEEIDSTILEYFPREVRAVELPIRKKAG